MTQEPMFPSVRPTVVYIIYDADVLSTTARFIEQMSPGQHLPAGFREDSPEHAARVAVAAEFAQTEGDEQYDFGYLGNEGRRLPSRIRWFPYGTLDAEGTEYPDDDYEGETGEGQHRKWVALLTYEQWLLFAGAYCIDLDSLGYPDRYEETMGSLTEFGHLDAVSVDNREGWDNPYNGDTVISSQMYVSFGYDEDPYRAAAELELALAVMADDGYGCAIGAGR